MCDFREMIPKWTLALSILAALLHGVTMLQLVDLKVPPYTIRGQPVRLECHYDLEGEALYSVKWFKDGKEFFRFYPEDDPPAQVFRVQGVFVDLPISSDTAVMLKDVDVHGSGLYRCEVSAEAPSFKTVVHEKAMIVVDLPDASGPQIEGVRPRYHIGDTVRVNCTSSRSRPAAKLTWYINQEPADETFLRYYPTIYDEQGFQTSMLGLEFKVRQKHFKKGDLKMKCLATIDTLYWRSNEQSVEGDRPQKAPVLESRETFAPGKREASSGLSMKLSSTKKDTISLLSLSLILNLVVWLYYNDMVLTSLEKFCRIWLNREVAQEENESTSSLTPASLAPALVMTSSSHEACSPQRNPRVPGELSSPSSQSSSSSKSSLSPIFVNSTSLVKRATEVLPKFSEFLKVPTGVGGRMQT